MEKKLSRLVKSCLCLVAISILTGCVLQSLNKFYTDESRIPLPAVCGEWQGVEKDAKDTNENEKDKVTPMMKPWKFTEDNLVAYDEKNVASNIKTVYFKAGENIFVDCSSGELDKEKNNCVNGYWLFCMRNVQSQVESLNENLSSTRRFLNLLASLSLG